MKAGPTMGVEEGGEILTESEERWESIWKILNNRVPFKDEPFHPRSRTVFVRRRSGSIIGRRSRLHPVAFSPYATAFEMAGMYSGSGRMIAYLFIEIRNSKLRPSLTKRRIVRLESQNGKRIYIQVDDPFSISNDDIERLKVAAKGDMSELDEELARAMNDAFLALDNQD